MVAGDMTQNAESLQTRIAEINSRASISKNSLESSINGMH